jgi:hypothetical protein
VVCVLLAACGTSASSTGATPRVSIRANARAGQIPGAPSVQVATLGPRGADPSKAGGVQLDVLTGLLDDRPIFNGDFADPFALRTPDSIYLYATNTTSTRYAPAAHIPVIVFNRDSGFEGRDLGDALPKDLRVIPRRPGS